MSRKDLKIVYQFIDGNTGRRTDTMCSTVGELAEALSKEEDKEKMKRDYVLILTEGEESEVDRVSRCPLITIESFVRISEFVE